MVDVFTTLIDQSVCVLHNRSEHHRLVVVLKEQVTAAEEFIKNVVATKGLPKNSMMLFLWDVYSKHCDAELNALIAEKFPSRIVSYIPANLTELCQPLDRCFNATHKSCIAELKNKHNTEKVFYQLN